MPFDPMAPYGPLIETTVRVATWNTWANFGDWKGRYDAVAEALAEADADVVCLEEVWDHDGVDVAKRVADRIGLECASAYDWFEPAAMNSGTAVLSRWPVVVNELARVDAEPGGTGAHFQFVRIDGPRGPIEIAVVMLDWRPDWSRQRCDQVRELASFVNQHAGHGGITLICGDFNAGPDADELRMLTGRTEPAAPGFVFYDAWEVAGDGPGITWANANPLAAAGLLPDRRMDFVLSMWPRLGGAGHPVRASLLGAGQAAGPPPSDHYGVLADLRY